MFENILSTLCIIFIFLGLFFYNENLKFPGFNAFYICLATGLLIFLKDNTFIYKTLSLSLINYIGKISYSLYLIHWPIIVFFIYFNPSGLVFFDYLTISFISFILSIFFHNNFENFNLKKFKIENKNNFSLFLIVSILLIFISSTDFIKKFDYKIYSDNSKKLLNILSLASKNRGDLLIENTIIYEGSKKKIANIRDLKKNILIMGDSHSEDIFSGFLQVADKNYDIYWQHLPLECNKTLSLKPDWHITEKILFKLFGRIPWTQIFYDMCSNYYFDLKKSNKLNKLDYIIISMKWDEDEIKYINKFSDFFAKNSNAQIIFISKRIEIPVLDRSIVINDNEEDLNLFLNKNKKLFIDFNKRLKSKLEVINNEIIFYDLNKYICEQKICNFVDKDNFNYIDYSHLSLNGSKKVIQNFLKNNF